MTTATKTETKTANPEVELPIGKGEVAVFKAARLPYHHAIKDRFGIDRGAWKVLTEAIYPSAKSIDAILLALSYCQSRNLDVMKRPVHIVPMWSSTVEDPETGEKGGYVETIWPSIAELRTTAFRTGSYAGCDQAEFGPIVEQTFTGKVAVYKDRKRVYETKDITVKFPEWCRITVYRMLHSHRCAFVGPKVKWIEAYATIGKTNLPNDMWESRSEGQLEKCAEAAALRRAFPEELGNEYAAEEMEGRRLRDVGEIIEHAPRQPQSPSLTPPDPDGEGTTTKPAASSQAADTAAPAQPGSPTPKESGAALSFLIDSMAASETKGELAAWLKDHDELIDKLSDEDRRTWEKKFEDLEAKLK